MPVLDLRGQECPIPTIKAIEAMERFAAVSLLIVLDDAACAAEIPTQARRLGYRATSAATGAAEWTITLTPLSHHNSPAAAFTGGTADEA